jgi:hypothetical protein
MLPYGNMPEGKAMACCSALQLDKGFFGIRLTMSLQRSIRRIINFISGIRNATLKGD